MFSTDEVRLLARCAYALMQSPVADEREAREFLLCAAEAGDADSQLRLGLWLAKMDLSGARDKNAPGSTDYKRAITWLARAGDQGIGEAWYAIFLIYRKSEFSQRNLNEAYRYLHRAAEHGYAVAQYELGSWIWRRRNINSSADVSAVHWLRKSVLQGYAKGRTLLGKLASYPKPALWAVEAQRNVANTPLSLSYVLKYRIVLAARFGLTIPEALMIAPADADHGHCLEIDIRSHFGRARRRLILIHSDEDRRVLDEVINALDGVDCRVNGPEGSYRRRLYRLRKLVGC